MSTAVGQGDGARVPSGDQFNGSCDCDDVAEQLILQSQVAKLRAQLRENGLVPKA